MPLFRSTLGLALLGSLLVYLSLPPAGLWPLAWIAPVPWILLIRQDRLDGKRPYLALWLAGFALWLGAIHWLRLPHWTTYFGWLALSFYLAFYLPVFVGLARVAVHRWRLPVIAAAPIVWTGLELARGHLLSGFTMGSLAHTQIAWTAVIQGADVVGCYGISGLVMFSAACAGRMIPRRGEPIAWWPLAPLAAMLALAVGYGHWRMSGDYLAPGAAVALLQGKTEADIDATPEENQQVFGDYIQLTQKAIRSRDKLSLIVWPETMYRNTLVEFPPDFQSSAELSSTSLADLRRRNLEELRVFQQMSGRLARDEHGAEEPPSLLLGIAVRTFANDNKIDNFNSALFVDPAGVPLSRYDKMHPVMFGEYIPLAEVFPVLYSITPLTGGLTAGDRAVAEEVDGVCFAPNICYETVIPHLIRRQVLELAASGNEPDVLVNLTNDGWFRGSSELDMHLACGVFRAVEMRKPLVIAANTGLTAWIDGDGRILKQLPRKTDDVLIADVELDARQSFYLQYGDLFAGLCLAICLGFAATGIGDAWYARKA